jgi:hypothetical protein
MKPATSICHCGTLAKRPAAGLHAASLRLSEVSWRVPVLQPATPSILGCWIRHRHFPPSPSPLEALTVPTIAGRTVFRTPSHADYGEHGQQENERTRFWCSRCRSADDDVVHPPRIRAHHVYELYSVDVIPGQIDSCKSAARSQGACSRVDLGTVQKPLNCVVHFHCRVVSELKADDVERSRGAVNAPVQPVPSWKYRVLPPLF